MRTDQPEESDPTDAELVNYMPGTPAFSGDLGRIETVLQLLTRRRGGIRPVENDDTVVRTDEA
ncbi:MAG: hypothetical protein PPP58_08400 [Natronomonas sp.]